MVNLSAQMRHEDATWGMGMIEAALTPTYDGEFISATPGS